MKIDVILNEPNGKGKFADIKLRYTDLDSSVRDVSLNIGFGELHSLVGDTTSLTFDFFLISAIVYGVDNLLGRYLFSIDAWAREIEVTIPVQNPTVWNASSKEVEEVLTFLTGDYWNVSFTKATVKQFYKRKASRLKDRIFSREKSKYTFASLFSGGLDSLIGVIDNLNSLTDNDKGLLISHFDGTSPGANSDQERLNAYLANQAKYNFDWIQEPVSLSSSDNTGKDVSKESSYRSRSILFISIGVYCVEHLPNVHTLLVPENGTISLNYPLTPSRSSTLSTRTTHPFYLRSLQSLINKIGIGTTIESQPYVDMTKGEMVVNCANQKALKGIYQTAVSCGKRGRKQHWDTRSGTSHCGVCMPCIYRRAALHKNGWDTQLYGIDIFTTPKTILEIQDMPALFDFLKTNQTSEVIKRTIMANGAWSDNIDKNVALVNRVKLEIKDWLKAKGNKNLKDLAGIK